MDSRHRIIVRVDRELPGIGGHIAFLDSGESCNPGHIMFWDAVGGHGEGYACYFADRTTRPATESEAAAVLAEYCRLYPVDAGQPEHTPAYYRILKRLPGRYSPAIRRQAA